MRALQRAFSAVASRRSLWCRRGIRGQPKLSDSIFPVGRRPRPTRSTRRGAFPHSSRRPRAQPDLHHLPRPRRLDGDERRADVSGPDRAHSRRHAQGRRARTMTATRRLVAILAVDLMATRASWARTRRGRRCLRAARAARPIAFNGNDRFPQPRPRGLVTTAASPPRRTA